MFFVIYNSPMMQVHVLKVKENKGEAFRVHGKARWEFCYVTIGVASI